ncbi:MAG: SDR family NAD(P)-dependent oxidoreductase [Candidatus Protistobacter heckmanni]|nr:SDR family NAD(P)-dependent oxidoreductase [Candidatus Protistobacter heckmanni]
MLDSRTASIASLTPYRVAGQTRAAGAQVAVYEADLSDTAAIPALAAAVIAAHQDIRLLVNNAGVALGGLFEQLDAADFSWLMRINFDAPVAMTRAFLPVLKRAPAAQIVNISSIFGVIAPAGQSAYSASKFAVRGFSEALRHELAMLGSTVGVTVVHPGGVDTSIAANARIAKSMSEEQRNVQKKTWQDVPKLSPDAAADIILDAIERRLPRVLVGKDARQAELVQRLFPVTYWKKIARKLMPARTH